MSAIFIVEKLSDLDQRLCMALRERRCKHEVVTATSSIKIDLINHGKSQEFRLLSPK